MEQNNKENEETGKEIPKDETKDSEVGNEEKSSEEKPQDETSNSKSSDSTGKETLNTSEDQDFITAATNALTEAGFDTDEVGSELQQNNGEVSKELYDKLVNSSLGKEGADSLVQSYNAARKDKESQISDIKKQVFEQVGGEETWSKIVEWSKTDDAKISKKEASEYNSMISQGGIQAELAVKSLMGRYMKSPGSQEDANLLTGDSTSGELAVKPISRSEYTEEKKKAFSKNDGVLVQSLERRARYTMDKHPDVWKNVPISG